MNLILHQIARDLRAQRGPLALWLALILAAGLFEGLGLDRFVLDRESASRLYMAALAVGYAGMAFGWFIAARIIQADPLDTTTAFWLTRPLPAWRLLVSKLLAITSLFLILPCAAATGVAAANGVRGDTLLHVAVQRATTDAALLLPITLMAAVTRDLPRFAFGMVAAAVLYAVAQLTALMPFSWVAELSYRRDGLVIVSGRLVAIGATIVGSLLLLAHQYVTRRTKRTMAIGAAALVAIVGIAAFWPWSFWEPTHFQPAAVDAGVFDAARVRLEFDLESLRRADPSRGEIGVRGTFKAHGLPAGWVAHIQRGRGELRFATAPGVAIPGGNVSTPYDGSERPGALAGDLVSAFEQALGASLVNAPQSRGRADAWLLRAAERTFAHFMGVPAEYSATMTLIARRVEAGAALPLRAGASGTLGSVQVTIVAVDRTAIRVRETRPDLFFPWGEPEIRLALRNRSRGEAILLVRHVWSGGRGVPLRIGPLVFRSEVGAVRDDGVETPLDPQWMAGAELVMLALRPVGTFQKTVTISGFVLPPSDGSRN